MYHSASLLLISNSLWEQNHPWLFCFLRTRTIAYTSHPPRYSVMRHFTHNPPSNSASGFMSPVCICFPSAWQLCVSGCLPSLFFQKLRLFFLMNHLSTCSHFWCWLTCGQEFLLRDSSMHLKLSASWSGRLCPVHLPPPPPPSLPHFFLLPSLSLSYLSLRYQALTVFFTC